MFARLPARALVRRSKRPASATAHIEPHQSRGYTRIRLDGLEPDTPGEVRMPIVRDSLLLGGLLATLLFVHLLDRWTPETLVAQAVAPPEAEARSALPDAPPPVMASESRANAPAENAVTERNLTASDEGGQGRTGIIDSSEPVAPKLIDEPRPEPPKLIETTPPPPPKVVDIEEPPPPPPPPPPPVKFFETETRAQSVGYVVDCSSSMAGAKFQAVCLKLAESIMALQREQEFFVVFFNDGFLPMNVGPAPKLVKADSPRKREILRFLAATQATGGTNPEPALQCMTSVRPDVIYLLTDGEFSPLAEATYQGFKNAGVEVHTLGFETAGPVAVLEEIARRTGGTYQPAARGTASASMLFAPDHQVRAALANGDPVVRRDAARAAVIRGLPFEIQLIDMLRDPDADLRDTILAELREAAHGSDFGPTSMDDVDGAIRRWKLWRVLRGAPRSRLLATLRGDDPDGRWVAAAVARANKLNTPDELIAALRAGPPGAVPELHAALVHCGGGEDFGPAAGATAAQVDEAADRWQEWRAAALAREAAARREQRVRRAADLLKQAKNLIGVNNLAVKRRYQELVADYGDTPSGEEARRLLETLTAAGATDSPP